MMTALQLYEQARARGIQFDLIGPATVRFNGPAKAVRELREAIDASSCDIVAVVEEFSADTAPVVAAQALLRGLKGELQPHGLQNA